MNRPLLLLALSASVGFSAHAQTTRYDGAWKVTMTCPPHNGEDDEAKGYTHRFTGQIVNGELSATHGKETEPGWHFLHGQVKSDGDANLRLEGVVNNPKYAINDAPMGKQYSYRVKAHFDETSGSGQRLTGRVCEFKFAR
jgi:hypothetical protein